jgi:membrane fusion protein (multidrug efflux system)
MTGSNKSGFDKLTEMYNDPVQKKLLLQKLGMAGGALVFLFLIKIAYDSFTYETTDDAEISAHTATLSSKVGGIVVDVPVEQNQEVHAGDVLLKLEAADYQNRVDQMQAEYGSVQARLADAEKVALRNQKLLKSDSVSLEQADSTQATYQELSRKAASLNAQLSQAKLDLDRTMIKAPADGKVGRRAVEKGVAVSPGQGVISFVQSKDRWVDANFKETQIKKMKIGQEAEIEIDSVEGHTFRGKISSFAPGTGATFAVLPPDNATGNFVKIVQRVPVRIAFDEESIRGYEDRLLPGLSANVTVRIR